jgi:hypothetical protein
MDMELPLKDRRYTIQDAHSRQVALGLENIEGTNGCLMQGSLAVGETRHWHDLKVGEYTNLRDDLIVVRVL